MTASTAVWAERIDRDTQGESTGRARYRLRWSEAWFARAREAASVHEAELILTDSSLRWTVNGADEDGGRRRYMILEVYRVA